MAQVPVHAMAGSSLTLRRSHAIPVAVTLVLITFLPYVRGQDKKPGDNAILYIENLPRYILDQETVLFSLRVRNAGDVPIKIWPQVSAPPHDVIRMEATDAERRKVEVVRALFGEPGPRKT